MSEVFRIEKTDNFTIMSNHHLKNRSLSLKAKGLMSQMLSLPKEWDYTLIGLTKINKDSKDSIRTGIYELERAGYIYRTRERLQNGTFGRSIYTVREVPAEVYEPHATQKTEQPEPKKPKAEKPTQAKPKTENPTQAEPTADKPTSENPTLDEPTSENPTQSNTNKSSTNELNTDLSSIHLSTQCKLNREKLLKDTIDGIEKTTTIDAYRDMVKRQIEYDTLCRQYDPSRVSEIVELIVDTLAMPYEHIYVNGVKIEAEQVKRRLLELDQTHIQYVFDCTDKAAKKINNIKSYLLTALYNAPATINSYYTAQVNHDMNN